MLFLFGFLLFFYALTSAIGFILLPSFGEIYASGLLSILILIEFLFGDRILLGFMRAKLVVDQNRISYMLSNIRLKFSLSRVNLYTSRRVRGWHIIDNAFSSPVIVVNPETLKRLSDRELEAMLSLACFKISRGIARKDSIYLVLFSIILSPVILCNILEKYRLDAISSLIKFLLMPFILLKGYVLNTKQIQDDLVKDFLESFDLAHELEGGLYKVNINTVEKRSYLFEICTETISLTHKEGKEKLSYYLKLKQTL
ncbi:hypothetical protein BIY24_15995 [Halobacteriovorax marinus]|uniref:hypothetical protein n=1 Tax=Halobacteriovorax marinus TaxID=97084 RepID=UPI0003013B5C|nr:hypothetical protein [Halobacteriovorax marinus]ATH09386.1 hypothetical protein BIY24_15995 [Halobacteriovorax marinus]